MKFKALTLLFFLSISHYMISQIKITGQIIDYNDNPVSFAEIILLTKDSISIKSDLSNVEGIFYLETINKGDYIIQIRQLGDIFYNKEINLNNDIDLGKIRAEVIKSLNEVVITHKKKLIEKKIDRLVFNIENSTLSSGGDAIDALKITPGLRVINDNITMIGRSNMSVMVNDKFINLAGDDLINYLKNLKSDDLKKIEVITTPPAKYDAQGNSGLINIVTKSIKKNSFNGSINSYLSVAKKTFGKGGLNLNYQKDKLTISTKSSYANGSTLPYQEYSLEYPNYFWSERNDRRNFINNLTNNLTIDYKISSKIRIGTVLSNAYSQPLIKTQNNSLIFNTTKTLDSIIRNNSRIEMLRKSNAINLYSIIKLDTIGTKLNFDLDYLNYNYSNDNKFYSNSYFANGEIKPNNFFSANNNSLLNIDIFTTQLDLDLPLKWASLNMGTKFTFIKNRSDVAFFNTTEGNPILDPLQTNIFKYDENIQAFYFSGTKNLSKKIQCQIGLRAENTQTNGFSETLAQTSKNNYFKLFPTFFLNYSINDYKIASLTYNKRINRPSYNDLNPFRFYTTSFNYGEGNPYLQPYITHNIELSYIYKNSYTMFYASNIENGFDQVTYVEPNSIIQRITPNNFYNQVNYGFFEGYGFNYKDIWENNSDISIYYTKTNSKISTIVPSIETWSCSINTNNSINLDKNKRSKAEFGFLYQFPSLAGSYKLSSFYQLNIGFRSNFFNKKLQFAINASDVLKTTKQIFTQNVNGIQQTNLDYGDLRRIKFSLTYNFGNDLKINKRKNANEDEKKRIN
ncbi:outer membrane beta-barrel protein [Flavobacterium sp.]|uniref:outer membrane beta-barrel protein n=1 Tax=Flavobacterium sp. TaxID=239 RepID=UPI0040478D50